MCSTKAGPLTFATRPTTEGDLRSNALPGGSLIRALLDRRLMGLADLGGSSAIIGARWSDIVSDHIDALVGNELAIPGGGSHVIEQVIRLDSLPHVGYAASKRSLQNPDFVLLGRCESDLTLQAADAKFSIETARSKQVSVEMLTALAEVGPDYTNLLDDWHTRGTARPGLFFSPQSALTAYVLSGGRGITRATVDFDEVVLLEASGAELTWPIPGRGVRQLLAELDGLHASLEGELLLGLYYTRLSSAAGASWFDMHRPLFGPSSADGADFDEVEREVERRLPANRTAYELVTRWALDAEQVRADRGAINQAAGLPLPNRELREWTVADSLALGVDPPSLNRVRKELQRWVHQQLLDEIGVIEPIGTNVPAQIARMRGLVAAITPNARAETKRIVRQISADSDSSRGGIKQVLGKQEDVAKDGRSRDGLGDPVA
jgi:hypothetical protein